MFARSAYSQKQLQNRCHSEIHEMLHNKGLNWADLSEQDKNGTFIVKNGERIQKRLSYEEINGLLGIQNYTLVV